MFPSRRPEGVRELLADDVLRGRAPLTFHDFELDLVAFLQRAEALALNRREMDEAIFLAILTLNKPKAFALV